MLATLLGLNRPDQAKTLPTRSLTLRLDTATLRPVDSRFGRAWKVVVEGVDRRGQVLTTAPVWVTGCEPNGLGAAGYMIGIGEETRHWTPEGQSVVDRLAAAICLEVRVAGMGRERAMPGVPY